MGLNVGFLSGGGCPPVPNLLDDLHPTCFNLFDRLGKVLGSESNLSKVVVSGCFNCYFINVGNPWGSDKRAEIGEDGELRPVKWDPKKLKNQMKRVYRKKPEDGSPGSSQSNDSDITSQNS
jgi:hypothetical protein